MADNDKKPADPADMWRNMLGEMEKNMNAFASKAMESEQFSRFMNQASGMGAGAKKTFGDMMERYLATMNLPSRTELGNIGERLQTIEARLNEIIDLLHRSGVAAGAAAPASPAPKPPRTRRPAPPPGGPAS